jgi:hypothetical protein
MNFITSQLNYLCLIIKAPFLQHFSVDGYLFTTYFLILEAFDNYGFIVMGVFFTLFIIYYRNALISKVTKLANNTVENTSNVSISNFLREMVTTVSLILYSNKLCSYIREFSKKFKK